MRSAKRVRQMKSDRREDNGINNNRIQDDGIRDHRIKDSRIKDDRIKDREKKKMPAALIILQVVLVAVLCVIIGLAVKRKKVDRQINDANGEETAAVSSVSNSSDDASSGRGTEDVLLFGVKKDDPSEGGTRNYLIVCHIDYDQETVKLETIYRDALMDIPGYGDLRVMSAYQLGGPELVLDTVNQNLDLQVENYAVVYYTKNDSLHDIADAVNNQETEKVASLTADMLDNMESNTNTEHERKWVGALGNYEITSSETFPAHFYGGEVQGTWVEVPVTLTDCVKEVHSFLYGEDTYTPGSQIEKISSRYQKIADTANDDLSGAP